MPRTPTPPPLANTIIIQTSSPKKKHGSAQAVEYKFLKVCLLPKMTFNRAKIIFKGWRAPQT